MAIHATKYEWTAWGLTAAALVFVLAAKLLPALLAGLLVYDLVVMLSPRFVSNKLSHSRAKLIVVALISAAVLAVLIGAVLGTIPYYKVFHVPIGVSLAVVAGVLACAVIASLVRRKRQRGSGPPEDRPGIPPKQ